MALRHGSIFKGLCFYSNYNGLNRSISSFTLHSRSIYLSRKFKFNLERPDSSQAYAISLGKSEIGKILSASKFKRAPKNDDNASANRKSVEDEGEEGGDIRKFNSLFLFGTSSLAVMGVISWLMSFEWSTEIYFNQFVTDLWESDIISKLEVVNNSIVRIFLNDENESRYHFKVPDLQYLENKICEVNSFDPKLYSMPRIEYTREIDWFELFSTVVPPVLAIFFLSYLVYRSGQTGATILKGGRGLGLFGKKHLFKPSKSDVKFKDVAGCDEAKVEIEEFVKFLKEPKAYEELGAKLPKGALLTGSPGTGKTMLAKATAGEANVPFFSISGSEFSELFVGVGSARVRNLFSSAQQNAPSIIFIDEIDAIGRKREHTGRNDERDNTLNQLLVEMDGFSTNKNSPVIVLAGTNRPDVLDNALLRPGRFDRKIELELPDIRARKQILQVHLEKLRLEFAPEHYYNKLAAMSAGFSGADLANLCNEAALIAARNDSTSVKDEHFIAAIDRIVAGIENRTLILSDNERRTVAYHEAGHALVSWFLEGGDPLLKVTIIPRGKGLGYAMYIPEEYHLYTKDVIDDKMTVALSGRAAEEIKFNVLTTGARDDLEKVTDIAYGQVLSYGMSKNIGPTSYGAIKNDGHYTKTYSQKTASMIDQEVREMIQKSYDRAKTIINENYEKFESLAMALYEKEVLDYQDCERILGKRPFSLSKTQMEFLNPITPPPPPPPVAHEQESVCNSASPSS